MDDSNEEAGSELIPFSGFLRRVFLSDVAGFGKSVSRLSTLVTLHRFFPGNKHPQACPGAQVAAKSYLRTELFFDT